MRIDYKFVTFFASLVILNVVGMEKELTQNEEKAYSVNDLENPIQFYKNGTVGLSDLKLTSLEGIEKLEYAAPGYQRVIEWVFASQNMLADISVLTKLRNLSRIFISNNFIKELPNLSSMTSLHELTINANQIKSLMNEGNEFLLPSSLECLCINNNELDSIPDSFAVLTNLTFLAARNNNITTITTFLAALKKLNMVFLSYNKLPELPDTITEIGISTSIFANQYDFSHNLLNKLPENIGDISKNQRAFLFLQSNKLKQIPISIGNLHNLSRLDLSNNDLNRLPDEIGNCTELRILTLNNNKLDKLPESITKLINLQDLQIMDNPNLQTKVSKMLYTFLCALDAKGALHCGNPIAKQPAIPTEIRRTIYEYVS
ncbi:MAG: leucine-rich repeat domain-containing protein [Candidatus Dependentiae bacterium]